MLTWGGVLYGFRCVAMILRERLTLAMNYVGILEDLRSRVCGVESLRDPVVRGAVERYLHLAVEALIDVGMRLCSILQLRRPESYRDVARVLREAGILGDEDARRLELWIGLRNILVHGYARIDVEKLLQALQEAGELREIASKLVSFIVERDLDPGVGDELRELVEKVRRVLEKRSFVVFAYIFGSRVRRERAVKGDVDVAIYAGRGLSWRELVEMMNELEDLVGTRVDLVDLSTAPLTLAYEAVKTGVVALDRDPEKRVEYEVKILREYLDLKPRLENYFRTVIRQSVEHAGIEAGGEEAG